jgi:hypothetical protein
MVALGGILAYISPGTSEFDSAQHSQVLVPCWLATALLARLRLLCAEKIPPFWAGCGEMAMLAASEVKNFLLALLSRALIDSAEAGVVGKAGVAQLACMGRGEHAV